MDLAGPVPNDPATADQFQRRRRCCPGSQNRRNLRRPQTAHPVAVTPKKPSLKTMKHASKPSKARKAAQKAKKPSDAWTAPRARRASWSAATAVRQGTVVPPAVRCRRGYAGRAAPDQVAATAESTSYLPWLPTFRIAPAPGTAGAFASRWPAARPISAPPPRPAEAAPAPPCKVLTASYGGSKTLLIRSRSGEEVQYTALTIVDGFERSMFEAYARTEAQGAEIVGEYPSSEAALADAKFNCPDRD